jgi:hypothetical protein
MQGNKIELLDMVAKLDDTAGFMMTEQWAISNIQLLLVWKKNLQKLWR